MGVRGGIKVKLCAWKWATRHRVKATSLHKNKPSVLRSTWVERVWQVEPFSSWHAGQSAHSHTFCDSPSRKCGLLCHTWQGGERQLWIKSIRSPVPCHFEAFYSGETLSFPISRCFVVFKKKKPWCQLPVRQQQVDTNLPFPSGPG